MVRTDSFDCGIMISASHNPYYDNGIKLINGSGEKMEESVIALVEDYQDGNLYCFDRHWQELPLAKRERIGRTVDYVAGRNRYIGYLISLGLYSFKGMKYCFDRHWQELPLAKRERIGRTVDYVAGRNRYIGYLISLGLYSFKGMKVGFDRHWQELPLAKRERIGRTVDYVAGRNRYIGYLISLGLYSFKGMKVGLDCANGSSWNIAKSVFDALGAKTYVINADPDGYNINTDAGSTHIEGLQKFVLENALDVGFAYDGDADRRQRLIVEHCQERVRRLGRQDLCHQRRSRRLQHQYRRRLHPHRGAAKVRAGKRAGCGLCLRRGRRPLPVRGREGAGGHGRSHPVYLRAAHEGAGQVDEKGQVVTGDHILYICGRHMKEQGKLLNNTVVTTVMSNFGLYKAFDELGIGYAKTAVGDKYVYEYMMKNGCRLGGEQSGHIIFSKYASTGDGLLTSLKVMEVMMAKKQPLSQLHEDLVIYPQVLTNVRVTDKRLAREDHPQVLTNVRVTDKRLAREDPAVTEAVEQVALALGDSGRILVRESGTEPVIRVMVEAPDHDLCQKYVDQVVCALHRGGFVAQS